MLLVIHLSILLIEIHVGRSVRETLLSNSYGISYAQVPNLLKHVDIDKGILALEFVGFEASNESKLRLR